MKTPETKKTKSVYSRREVLKSVAVLPFIGILGSENLSGKEVSGENTRPATSPGSMAVTLQELKGVLPKGRIGKHEISRLIIGGNPINGFSHSRDLAYVGSLFKAYNTEKKVFETLMLAEQAGINTIGLGYTGLELIAKYKKSTGSKINVIGQVGLNRDSKNIYELFDNAIDFGVDIIQIHGQWCDTLVVDKRLDDIAKLLDYIRKQGYTAGLGAHTIDSQVICHENGIIPDYYMVTMHHSNYWSAHPVENRVAYEWIEGRQTDHNKWHDNCFCTFPDRTVEHVNKFTIPVMGFKTLAAGAIQPKDGFRWAFENGADFINVGMFDFQIVNDINITIDILNNLPNRKRKWFS